MAGYWDALFPGEIPGAGEKVLPQLLAAGTLNLEGNELRVIRIGQADTAQSTVLHVPSLAAAVTGDLAYNTCQYPTSFPPPCCIESVIPSEDPTRRIAVRGTALHSLLPSSEDHRS